jgi:iron(III) transport system permease protein
MATAPPLQPDLPAAALSRRRLRGPERGVGWHLVALTIAMPALAVLLVVATALLQPDGEVWAHLSAHVLPRASWNTLWLVLGVGLGVSVLGTGLAALVALCEFPGRAFFAWALLLPLAVPAYVLATVYIGLFDYAGPLQTLLREHLPRIPSIEIRNRWGVLAVLVLALYPYLYLVVRNALASQGARLMEVARLLGHRPGQAFRRAALPLALPWIGGGTLLAMMETLADFGAVAAFNYDTLTTAIYRTWYGLFSISGALQIAAVLLLFVLALLALEQRARAGQGFFALGAAPVQRRRLGPRGAWLATLTCGLVWLLSFALPVSQLLLWAIREIDSLDRRYWLLAANSLQLALGAALLLPALALALSWAQRRAPSAVMGWLARLATLGYAMPGALLAVAFFAAAGALLKVSPGLAGLLRGSILLLLIAYAVRFLAVAATPINGAALRLKPSIEEAARNLGISGFRLFLRVHLPLLRGGVLTAALLVFVDVMKEMPITLMTRPFGWDTLAVRIFEFTTEGQWQRAALPALAIVAVGLLPTYWLHRGSEHAPLS